MRGGGGDFKAIFSYTIINGVLHSVERYIYHCCALRILQVIIICTDVTRAGKPMIIIIIDEDPSYGSKAFR